MDTAVSGPGGNQWVAGASRTACSLRSTQLNGGLKPASQGVVKSQGNQAGKASHATWHTAGVPVKINKRKPKLESGLKREVACPTVQCVTPTGRCHYWPQQEEGYPALPDGKDNHLPTRNREGRLPSCLATSPANGKPVLPELLSSWLTFW